MYERKDRTAQKQLKIISLEDLVPQEHILRGIDQSIDFTFIYDLVKGLYQEAEWGKPGIDPVSLFKIVFIQHLFGIKSMRQTIKEIEVNMAYRWFIGYDIGEPIPHFSTFGKNYSRRFKDTDIFEKIFVHILQEAIECGFVDESVLFIDSTHIKANANKKKKIKKAVPIQAKQYKEQLDKEVNEDREKHGKKPFSFDQNVPVNTLPSSTNSSTNTANDSTEETVTKADTKLATISTTDPESGVFRKGEHETSFAYTAHTACTRRNFIVGVEVSAGNIHDSVMFDPLYGQLKERFPKVGMIVVDSAYKTPWIAKQIIDDQRIILTGYKRPMTKKGFFKKNDYVYDEHFDCMICPAGEILKYATTNREGYREYKSDGKVCAQCEYLSRCTESKKHQKMVTRHIWEAYLEIAEDYRYGIGNKELYKERSQTIERVFADAKERHGMRYTLKRGLAKVRDEVMLIYACMNLKKLAKWKKTTGKLTEGRLCYFICKSFVRYMETKRGIGTLPMPLLSTI